jgi:hypothetical protein
MTKPTMRVGTPRATATPASSLHTILSLMGGWISTVAAGTNAWTGKFIESLHETRRQEAHYTIDRYRQLLRDQEEDKKPGSKPH